MNPTIAQTQQDGDEINFTTKYITSGEEYNDKYAIEKDKYAAGLSVLTIGDPHFTKDNLPDINVFITKIINIVKNEHPDFVVILGDLLDTHGVVLSILMNKAYMFIYELSKLSEVYVLVGNHDYINNTQFLSTHHWMNAMKHWKRVHIVDTGVTCTTQYGKFIFCPYVFPGRFIEALSIIDPDWKSSRTIFCHQEFKGCKMGAITSIEGDEWDINNPFVISGHIHDKQRIQDNVFYTGSAIQHSFGESHDKTISMCYFGSNIRIENLNLGMPTKKILYIDVDNIDNFNYTKDTEDKLRITVSGTYEQFKEFRKTKKYKNLVADGVKIVYRDKRIQASITTIVNEEFHEILYKLIESEKQNDEMLKIYSEIFATT